MMIGSRAWDFRERERTSKKFRIGVKGEEVEYIVSQGEIKFANARWEVAILLFSGQKTCLGILIELWVDEKTLRTLCDELTYFTALHAFRVSVKVTVVNNMALAKKATWWWPKIKSEIKIKIKH